MFRNISIIGDGAILSIDKSLRTVELFVLVMVIVLHVSCRQEPQEESDLLPSYKLKAGQVLVYESTGEFKYDKDSFLSESESQIWVLRRNENGSWHLIARNEDSFAEAGERKEPEVNLVAFDLFPDGRIESRPHPVIRNVARGCFIRLPADPNKFWTTWEAFNQEQDEKHVYSFSRRSRPRKGQWVFKEVTTSQMNEIYGMSQTSTVHFNARKGLVEKIESTYSQTYGFTGKGKGITKLKSVKTVDPDFVNRLAADAETYFRALKGYSKLLSSLAEHPDSVDAKLTEAKKVLLLAKDQVSHPIVTEELDRKLTEHEENINYWKDKAKAQSAVLNQPSPSWETTDFKGQTYSIEALRGKVVVLDFWYRGCGWCIRAMPQVKQVAAYFANQPVVVLGMNIDGDPADAEFVIEKMGLNYPNLKAEGIPQKYGVRGYPTLIVIDQNGIVKDFHVGYSPDLRDNVIRSVEELLKLKPNESIDPDSQ